MLQESMQCLGETVAESITSHLHESISALCVDGNLSARIFIVYSNRHKKYIHNYHASISSLL